ncbi:hypothetical protein MASR1M45_30780 [Candidatus Kapaibacterium sp.]
MISINVNPENKSMPTIWNDTKSWVNIVKNGAGKTYIPAYNINQIGDWNLHHGYQAYLTSNKTLVASGSPIEPENSPIILNSGWNIIPYLRSSNVSIVSALASLTSSNSLVIAKNNSGKTHIPQYNINQIGNMEIGQGYQVYLSKLDTLYYPSNSQGKGNSSFEVSPEPNFLIPAYKRTGNSSTLIIRADNLPNKSEIGVYNTDDMLIGSGILINGTTAITIWRDDENSTYVDGAKRDEKLSIKVYNNISKKLYEAKLVNIINYFNNNTLNGFTYVKDSFVTADLETEGTEVSFISINPHPATGILKLQLMTKNNSKVSVQLINLAGELIQNIVNDALSSGAWYIESDISKISSGEYNVVIKIDNLIEIRKLIINN